MAVLISERNVSDEHGMNQSVLIYVIGVYLYFNIGICERVLCEHRLRMIL